MSLPPSQVTARPGAVRAAPRPPEHIARQQVPPGAIRSVPVTDRPPSPGDRAPSVASTIVRAGIASIPVVGGPLEIIISDTIERRRARVAETGEAARSHVGDDELLLRRLNE